MTFSAKVVAGGVLTFFMLGLSHLLQHGQFLAPFPFISEFTLVMTLIIVFSAVKIFKFKSIPFVVYAITGTLAGRFLWEILLPLDEIIHLFEDTLIIDGILLIHYFSLLCCIVIVSSWIKKKVIKWLHLAFMPLLIVSVFYNGGQLLFGWFVLYGALCVFSFTEEEKSNNGLKESLELFSGLGLIYLLSIISILWN